MSELSLLPVTIDLRLQQKADYLLEVQITDGTNPIDISLDTIKVTVKTAYGGTLKIQKVNAPGGHSTPAVGKTRFALTKADLTVAGGEAMTFAWVYEVRRIIAGSLEEVPYISGNFRLGPVIGT